MIHIYNSFNFGPILHSPYCVLARTFYSWIFYPEHYSLHGWFRTPLQDKSIVYVICFLSYAISTSEHVTSNFPFTSSVPYFLWNTYRYILMSQGVVTCQLLRNHNGFARENWHLWGLMEHQCPRPGQCHPIVSCSEYWLGWGKMIDTAYCDFLMPW